MNADGSSRFGIIAVEILALIGVVALVDLTPLRLALCAALGLLLARSAPSPPPAPVEQPQGAERRRDDLHRERVNRLLYRIREFHNACRLLQEDAIDPATALQRVAVIEEDLNRLLAEVVRASRTQRERSPSDRPREAVPS